jgi:hypothetical protein
MKGLSLLQNQMKTLSSKLGSVDNTTSFQMETKVLIVTLIISKIWVCVVI